MNTRLAPKLASAASVFCSAISMLSLPPAILIALLLGGCTCGTWSSRSASNGGIECVWFQVNGCVYVLDPVELKSRNLGILTLESASREFRVYTRGHEMTIYSAATRVIYAGKKVDFCLPSSGRFIGLMVNGRGCFLDATKGKAFSSDLTHIMGVDGDHALGYRDGELVVYKISARKVRAVIKGSPEAWPVQDSRVAVRRNGLWGFCDLDGNEVVACRYRSVRPFNNGIAAVQLEDLTWRYLRKEGDYLITPPLGDAGDFSEGVATCNVGGVHHLVDSQGLLTMADGDDSDSSRSGMKVAEARPGDGSDVLCGYIGRDGRWVLPPKFDQCYGFCGDYAVVKIDDDLWLINKTGIVKRLP
jgi:WG containing repeat